MPKVANIHAGATVLILAMAAAESAAQDGDLVDIHRAYSSYFGSGWYSVAEDRDVFVVRVTKRCDLFRSLFDW